LLLRNGRRSRPVLLILVYSVFLVLIGITASAQAMLVSEHVTAGMLNSVVGDDSATVRTFLNGNLTRSDLNGTATAARQDAVDQQLAALIARGGILRLELRNAGGTILFSNEPDLDGRPAPVTAEFRAALDGAPSAGLDSGDQAAAQTIGDPLGADSVLREFLPVIIDGHVVAVFAMWRDAAPTLAVLASTRGDVVMVTLAAAMIAAAILFLVFRSAQARISRQTDELLEATRRDALTGLLNHGAVVAELTDTIDHARANDENVTIAVVDVDNFKLLNDTHGHLAGDEGLLAVSGLLAKHVPEGVTCGRYGPDEFLLVAPPNLAAQIEPALEAIVTALADLALQFGASERLPVTISAGIATFPEHADSATALLSTAAVTLGEAKASGGNAIRVANARLGENSNQSAFDVYQGLVIAVDTKDRYTKRHSEDVTRYALFLVQQLGLEEELGQTIRIAGLLHDVGKIGIPDQILRKPGALTASEAAVIQQHVALGDSIVRNLPNIDQVRAAIRHHHERWDGRGYLDHLAGEEIPLIARIVSVGDVFSAMTTSRPYRKALPVDEALRRLEDAAGSQLEERLVVAFVNGIRAAANPPLPGQDSVAQRLWTPQRAIA
jgi:diguanylate cyclase (GGDEF)-like protein/putative nucleotidyltransferase with HDIG domain